MEKKGEPIDCLVFVEAEGGVFDRYEASIEVPPELSIIRHIYNEIERNKARSVIFQTAGGRLPVQAQFICVPFDISRSTKDISVYERQMYARSMSVEIRYAHPPGESLLVQAKYRDTVAKTRILMAMENNTILPLYDIKKATIPLRGKTFEWGEEFADKIMLVRLWHNKIIRFEEAPEDKTPPAP